MQDQREAEGGCFTGRFAEAARQADPDRFLCVLPAPAAVRDRLCALILFNHELVRATELPSARSGAGPIATLIRLQWWREVIEGSRGDWQGDPVATELRGLLDRGDVDTQSLLGMIAAREEESDAPLPTDGWRTMLLGGAGGLQQAIGAVLGVDAGQRDRLAAAGAAFACGALRRYLPALAGNGRILLPDHLADAELDAQRAFLAEQGQLFLQQASGPRLPRGQGCALLPLVLARRDLHGNTAAFDRAAGARGLGDRLAVIAAGLMA